VGFGGGDDVDGLSGHEEAECVGAAVDHGDGGGRDARVVEGGRQDVDQGKGQFDARSPFARRTPRAAMKPTGSIAPSLRLRRCTSKLGW
jgi:hypothetical protein